MQPFQGLWASGLETARRRVGRRADANAIAIADHLESVSFPGAIAVLAGPGREGHVPWTDVVPGLVQHITGTAEARRRNASTAQIAGAFAALFTNRDRPSVLPEGLSELVVRKALERQGFDVTEDQLREVIELLETGRFFRDLETSATAVADTVPEVPLALIADLMRTPALLKHVTLGTAADVVRIPGLLSELAVTLHARLRGEKPPPPDVEPRVLAALYATESLETVRRLLSQLLHHDNRTVRLALILYARANHIAVSDSDIDVVYENLIRREQPNLGPVLERAIVVMAQHYAPVDPGELDRALAFLRARAA